jgi:hypothetical protein
LKLFGEIVQAGVHDQLCQKRLWKDTGKNPLLVNREWQPFSRLERLRYLERTLIVSVPFSRSVSGLANSPRTGAALAAGRIIEAAMAAPSRQCYLSMRWIFALAASLLALCILSRTQELAKRLILKDGTYQLATKYEVKGNRVRYLSAERGEWEEVPNSLVDWAATDKYEKERNSGAPPPEALALDKELAAERQAEEAKTPEVAPGLRLTEDNSVFLLDTFDNQPQLVELGQNGGELNRNTKGNIIRAAINPLASSKQTVELQSLHAKVQSHAIWPALYVNAEPSLDPTTPQGPPSDLPWDRFRIVRVQSTKQGKRVVGDLKTTVVGRVRQEQNLVPTTATQLTGGWVRVTPVSALVPGEYALVELLGKEGMNMLVWDFGVNPAAPANLGALKPAPSALQPKTGHLQGLRTEGSNTPSSPASPVREPH